MSCFQAFRQPTVLRYFLVQKVGTERVTKVRIYLHKKNCLYTTSQITQNIFPHLKDGHQNQAHPVRIKTTKVCTNLMDVTTIQNKIETLTRFNQSKIINIAITERITQTKIVPQPSTIKIKTLSNDSTHINYWAPSSYDFTPA